MPYNWDSLFVENTLTAISILASLTLSALLIYVTNKIGSKQNDLQKDIAERDIKLHQELANQSLQISLYQYHIECYMEVVHAIEVNRYDAHFILRIFVQGKSTLKELLQQFTVLRVSLLKSSKEARILFNKEVEHHITTLFRDIKDLEDACERIIVRYDKMEEELLKWCQAAGKPAQTAWEKLNAYHEALLATEKDPTHSLYTVFSAYKEYREISRRIYSCSQKLNFNMMGFACSNFRPSASLGIPLRHSKKMRRCGTRRPYRSGNPQKGRRQAF